jgi:hypothetical protein
MASCAHVATTHVAAAMTAAMTATTVRSESKRGH